MKKDLKECPFCGFDGEMMVWHWGEQNFFAQHPNNDCILSDFAFNNPESWNTRASDTIQEGRGC